MNPIIFRKRNPERGSVLVVTYILCILASMATLWMLKTLLDHQRTNQRRRDLNRAYYAAEAGVAQVVHWGNHPEEYDNLDEAGLFYRDPVSAAFPNLTETLNESGEYVISGDLLATFASKYNFNVSNINEIVLIPPDPDHDPVACLFKVRSEGTTPSGSTRRILAYIQPNPIEPMDIELYAGLISLSDAGQQGNGHAHWGESWSKGNFYIIGNSHLSDLDNTSLDYDPFAIYRTEMRIIFPPNWKSGLGKDIYQESTRRFPGSPPASGKYENGLEQFIPPGVLDWPDLLSRYQEFKDHAMSHGRYYSTDADGNIYSDGVEDTAHLVDFDTEFGNSDRSNGPYDLVFIDTINNLPPATDGSNMATIINSGIGTGMKGVFWIGANYDQRGSGNPADLVADKPIKNLDGSISFQQTTLNKVYLDGVLYMAGTAHFQGNPVIYGSVIAQKGYLSGGTPDIYFNHKLKDGLEIPKGNIGSNFHVQLQKNY
jgi:hypothetical protein